MSAFLGPIHYWLYNKIEVEESILESIFQEAKNKNYNIESLQNQGNENFGEAIVGELEDIISLENIHGWLQGRIASVESRLALTVTTLLNENILTLEEVISVFEKNAVETAKAVCGKPARPVEIFTEVYNNLLAGMPCDRVNQALEDNDNKVIWRKDIDIHKQYWDKVGGDVQNFHKAIDKWIGTFVKTLDSSFEYRIDGEQNIIERV